MDHLSEGIQSAAIWWQNRSSIIRKGIGVTAVLLAGLLIFGMVATIRPGGLSLLETEDGLLSLWLVCLVAVGFTLLVALSERVEQPSTILFLLMMVSVAFIIRLAVFPYQSGDYNSFLAGWIEQMRSLSFSESLAAEIGDYNMPYLYLLALISRTPFSGLYAIKLISVVFDGFLAFAGMKLVGLAGASQNRKLGAFLGILLLPTVLFNSAYWGQCDGIYAALSLLGLYAGLTRRGNLCVVLFAAAFSFKLQTVFLLPILVVLLFVKRIRLVHLLWFPVVFFCSGLPALFAGRDFERIFAIYFQQMEAYPYLHLHAANLFQLVEGVDFDSFSLIGMLLAGCAVLVLWYTAWQQRQKLAVSHLIALSFLFSMMLPYLLPRMHERYFFLADCLAVVYLFFYPKRWYFALIVQLSSYFSYCIYLMDGFQPIPLKYFAIAQLVVILLAARDLFLALRPDPLIPWGENVRPKP